MNINPSIADLKTEMKLIQWHKLSNEMALKAALLKNKESVKQFTAALVTKQSSDNPRNQRVKEAFL